MSNKKDRAIYSPAFIRKNYQLCLDETMKIIDSDFESALATAHYIALSPQAKAKPYEDFWQEI